jgi:hypothetical protein
MNGKIYPEECLKIRLIPFLEEYHKKRLCYIMLYNSVDAKHTYVVLICDAYMYSMF